MSKKSGSHWKHGVGFGRDEAFKMAGKFRLEDGQKGGKGHNNRAEAQQVEPEDAVAVSEHDVPTQAVDTDTTLSAEAIAELKFMIEEEKLAGDLYDVFYDVYGIQIFANIGDSEDRHFDAVSDYAEKIGIDVDSFVFDTAGEFSNPELQEMYDTLLEQGLTSLEDALEVGVAIEEKDIVDIAAAAEAVQDTALADIYEKLLQGSYAHLDAFEAVL